MAIITEVSVVARLAVLRNSDGEVRVYATGESLDATGAVVRSYSGGVDVTDRLSPAQLTGATAILTLAENRLREAWDIT